jgi:diphosphoinositol-polyphosphate diphosphatase
VPILKGGKILFVSSRKKPEWIFPKGGWEKDEAMEESAIREVFEEAGVLGVLGPRLSEIQYETRKAKKRRLEASHSPTPTTTRTITAPPEETEQDKTDGLPLSSCCNGPQQPASPDSPVAAEPTALLSAQDMERIRDAEQDKQKKQQPLPTDASIASSAASSHSQVRMTLYPLYVQKVHAEWPESGRFRKAVDIDTALQMLSKRPELQAALREVKERGLHLMQE